MNQSFFDQNYSGIEILSFNKFTVNLKYPYLRTSFVNQGKKVSKIISETLPNTFVLAFSAILIAIFVGLILGIISALNKGNYIDLFIQFISTIGMSVPSFFSAIIFAWIFGFVLADITVNKNMVPFDDKSPFVTSGIRIGTAAVTTRALKAEDMIRIVDFIDEAITNNDNDSVLSKIASEVKAFMSHRPLFVG